VTPTTDGHANIKSRLCRDNQKTLKSSFEMGWDNSGYAYPPTTSG
jgi:hypothetical protein